MPNYWAIGAIVLAVLTIAIGDTRALEESKYPDWSGQWERFVVRGLPGQPSFDQTKPWGFGQQAPLTPEYQKVLEDSIADQAKGGLGNYHTPRCLAAGMPLMMIAFRPLEFVVTPATTYILIGGDDHHRRIFTDGRSWPSEIEPTFAGYSIGKWIDEDGDGRYDVLEVETRGPFKGPRAYDASTCATLTRTPIGPSTIVARTTRRSFSAATTISSARTACLCQRVKISPRRTCDISNSHRNSDDRSDTHRASRRGGRAALGQQETLRLFHKRAHAR